MSRCLFNVTFHLLESHESDILEYLRCRLIPAWKEYPQWDSPLFLRIPPRGEDEMRAYALQWNVLDREMVSDFSLESDPLILLLMEIFREKVFPFATLMEEIEV